MTKKRTAKVHRVNVLGINRGSENTKREDTQSRYEEWESRARHTADVSTQKNNEKRRRRPAVEHCSVDGQKIGGRASGLREGIIF